MKKFHSLFLLLATVLLCACGSKGDNIYELIDYFPFQSAEDGRWGLIGTDGKVLFEDEFEHRPTVAVNGRFMVKNADGLWEIYTAEEKPKQVGTAYKSAGLFFDDVAPVVEEGKCVTLIDRDGKEVKKLDKLDGKSVENVSNFWDGVAIFRTAEGYLGVIDTKGNVVLKPVFCSITPCNEGRLLAVDKKYEQYLNDDKQRGKVKVSLLDTKGNLVSEWSLGQYETLGGTFSDGVMYASVKRGDKEAFGLIDEKGEWALSPTTRIKGIEEVRAGHFIYTDGESYGVMDFKGETVIRAKYASLRFAANDLLYARDRNKDEYFLIDLKGEQVGHEEFSQCLPFYKGKQAFVELSDNYWGLIDRKGELQKGLKTDLYDVDGDIGDVWVESDYIDLDALTEAMKISANGLYDFTFSQKAAEVVALLASRSDNPYRDDAEEYLYRSQLDYSTTLSRADIGVNLVFPATMADAVTEPFDNGFYTYQRITGYAYRDLSPSVIAVTLVAKDKLKGKAGELYKKLSDRLGSLGATLQENEQARLVRFANGNFGLTFRQDDTLCVLVSTNDLTDLRLDDLSPYQAINAAGSSPGSSTVVEEAPADSVAVDSVAV